jgi:cell division protein ZipA
MPELRWILAVAGLVLIAGLWWWETRRRARAAQEPSAHEPDDEPIARPEAGSGPAVTAESTDGPIDEDDLPSIRASRRERGAIGRNPPVVEFPADAEPELARPRVDDAFVPPSVPYRSMQEQLDELPEDLRNLPRDERAEAEQRQPWVRTQPLDRRELMRKARQINASEAKAEAEGEPEGEEPEPPPAPPEPPPAGPAQQKIVALRLIANAGRWPGRSVIDALQAEGLTFGKYSIYHRERDDGKSIFFVASMVEPGSFNPDAADTQSYPGISIFAVVPGPVDAPTTFDLMLATARRLAERLSGHLQDEQGSTLTAQRILNLREELVHFEHVSRRVQKR